MIILLASSCAFFWIAAICALIANTRRERAWERAQRKRDAQ